MHKFISRHFFSLGLEVVEELVEEVEELAVEFVEELFAEVVEELAVDVEVAFVAKNG